MLPVEVVENVLGILSTSMYPHVFRFYREDPSLTRWQTIVHTVDRRERDVLRAMRVYRDWLAAATPRPPTSSTSNPFSSHTTVSDGVTLPSKPTPSLALSSTISP